MRRRDPRSGGPPSAPHDPFTPEELARSHRQTFDEMAEEALAAKYS